MKVEGDGYAIVNVYGDIVSQLGVHLCIYTDFATASHYRRNLMLATHREYSVKHIKIEQWAVPE